MRIINPKEFHPESYKGIEENVEEEDLAIASLPTRTPPDNDCSAQKTPERFIEECRMKSRKVLVARDSINDWNF
jgi:hypothetical protein